MKNESHESLASFRKVSASSNRRFGLTIGIIFALLAVLPLLRHQPIRFWLLVPALIIFIFGAVAPAWLAPLNQLWFKFGLLLGRVTNPIVMGVLFFLVIVPIGWLLRLSGHDLLRLKLDPSAASYWISRDPETSSSSLTKQF